MRSESLYFLFSPVSRIKGIGGATASAFQRLLPAATQGSGSTMPIVRDLLFHLPIGVIDRRFTCPLREAPDGVVGTFIVTVDEHQPPKRGSKSPYKVLCSNETGDITLVFFHASTDYIKQILPEGKKRVISGKVEHFDFRLQMSHPDIITTVDKLAEAQSLEPVYPLTAGLTSRRITKFVDDAIEKLPELPEWIKKFPPHNPLPQVEGELFPSFKTALLKAHHPETPDDLLPACPAHMRLAYDEILATQLHLAMLRHKMQLQAGEVITGTGALTKALRAVLPYQLTNGQEKALEEIYSDMASGHRMGRLLQGDVGSGKTIVALLAMLRAAEQRLQAALMVPTEIVARQHYENISKLLAGLTIKNVILTGSVKGNEREEALAAIASGEAKIIIGTHALFQEKVVFRNLALIVVDEQHRFGVEQRMALSAKGNTPHVLHMTATPIPRSLSMTMYGDMDISTIREKPVGRLPITTRIIPLSRYAELTSRMKAALDRGEKVYWICPLIEDSGFGIQDSGDDDIAAAKSRYTEFKARFGDIVGLVHGRMKADERNGEMLRFAQGATKLLVATTVIEVGVDVKDATIIVIERADRFGLSQLHQLRGRVGRGDKQSACVLLYSDKVSSDQRPAASEDILTPDRWTLTADRLAILRETEDGFRIAEEDLKLRGGGDLIGTRQSGLPRFVFTRLSDHLPLLEHARDDAKNIIATDPNLETERGKALQILLQLFGY